MTEAPSWGARPFTLVGGALCLDFANTAAKRETERPMERLTEPAALSAFAVEAGVCGAADGERLAVAIGHDPDGIFGFRILREAIYRTLHRISRRQPPGADDLRHIEDAYRATLSAGRLRLVEGRPDWQIPVDTKGGLFFAGAVLTSLFDVLSTADLKRLRICPRPDCGFVFLDISKAGRRRWCEMEVCGNRAKAERFARRRRHQRGNMFTADI